MRIKSNNTFKVNRKRLLKNAENIDLEFKETDLGLRAIRDYSDKESYRFGSNNAIVAILEKILLNYYLQVTVVFVDLNLKKTTCLAKD